MQENKKKIRETPEADQRFHVRTFVSLPSFVKKEGLAKPFMKSYPKGIWQLSWKKSAAIPRFVIEVQSSNSQLFEWTNNSISFKSGA